MITIKLPIQLSESDAEFVKQLQIRQSSLIGSAYQFIRKHGFNQKQITNILNNKMEFDSWLKQSAAIKAKEMTLADKDNTKGRLFGGMKALKSFLEGKISKLDYQNSRLMPLYVVGEASKSGNRKFKLDIYNNKIIFKADRNNHLEINLPNLRKNYSKKLQILQQMAENKATTFTVSMATDWISLSFEELPIKQINGDNLLSLDLNPNYIGLAIRDRKSNIIHTKMYDISHLKDANKQKYELSIISNEIMDLCEKFKCGNIAIEDLSISSKDHNKGKNFNRAVNNKWNRRDFIGFLKRKAKLFGIKLYEINPAYSSIIGNLLNRKFVDCVASAVEIGRRTMEICVKKQRDSFYPAVPTKEFLSRQMDVTGWNFSDWRSLSTCLKNSKLRYRISLPKDKVFQEFKSRKSLVLTCDGIV
jgi:IS605 OrfB family transposase